MPVLANDDDADTTAQPTSTPAGAGNHAPLTIGDVPADALQPLVPVASTGNRARWRVERFGPKAPDGKGRYWQWRRGSGKQREATYGGKIQNNATEYWQYRSASTGRHASSGG